MPEYIIFSPDSGRVIVRYSGENIHGNILLYPGSSFVEGCYPEATHVIDGNPVRVEPEPVWHQTVARQVAAEAINDAAQAAILGRYPDHVQRNLLAHGILSLSRGVDSRQGAYAEIEAAWGWIDSVRQASNAAAAAIDQATNQESIDDVVKGYEVAIRGLQNSVPKEGV